MRSGIPATVGAEWMPGTTRARSDSAPSERVDEGGAAIARFGSESAMGAIGEDGRGGGTSPAVATAAAVVDETASRRMTDVLESRARRKRRILFFFCAGSSTATREKTIEIVRRAAS